MAEAVVENQSSQHRFYCHTCSVEISPNLPEFTCPKCKSGFVEEITDEFSNTSSNQPPQDPDPANQFTELWGRAFLENFRNQPGRPEDDQRRSSVMGRRRNESIDQRSERYQDIERLFFQLISPFPGDMPTNVPVNILPLHGNLGDYAWGAGGLDSVISQLMNHFDGTGVPPAEKEKIDSLPVKQITQEHVDKKQQCVICLCEFQLNEQVKQLGCQHKYHIKCIDTWLIAHGNCPVCRKDLNGRETTAKDYSNPLDLS